MINVTRLKELKKSQGRETSWLAEQSRVSPFTMREILRGKRNPGKPALKLLADALGVSEDELRLSGAIKHNSGRNG